MWPFRDRLRELETMRRLRKEHNRDRALRATERAEQRLLELEYQRFEYEGRAALQHPDAVSMVKFLDRVIAAYESRLDYWKGKL